ncbi:FAR1-related sequence 5-like protein [Tanacetum coccineum]|uniref:FAR1-related sequence 5-like protein n=1 Tax=Tanacetum coccineum TaxID=301880 RepID=A0ABQ4YAH9_9ASTR
MDENMDLNKQDMNMNENQLNNFMEAVENMDLNKQVFEKDNELESDTEDVLQEFANPNAVIEEVTDCMKTPRATLYEQNETPGGSIYWEPHVEGIRIPVEGTWYDTVDEAIDMYSKYAEMGGFEVKKSGQRLTKSGVVKHKYIMCNREGVPKGINVDTLDPEYSEKQKRNTTTHVTGCKARIKLVLDIVSGRYKLDQFYPKHNHMLIPKEYKHFTKKQRKMTQAEKMFVVKAATNKIGATRAHNLLSSMKGGYEYVHGTTDDFKNHQRDVNVFIGESDAQMLINKMENRKTYVPNFTFQYRVENSELVSMFWADEVAKCNYKEFGDILSFDATFNSNKYNMKFVLFIGIDNHRKCVTLGFRMLLHEDTKSYMWLLTTFMTAFLKEPTMIATDQDGAMKRAIKAICKQIYNETDLKERFDKIVWDMFIEPLKFEEKWAKLIEDFDLQNHKWMTKMFNIREIWIPAYFVDSMLFGLMRTTSRSESENSFFKSFTSPGATLVSFMMSYESAMERQRYRQEALDFKTIEASPKCETKLPIELHEARVYTRMIFSLVQTEIIQGCWTCTIQDLKINEGCETVIIRDKNPNDKTTLNTKKGKEQEKKSGTVAETARDYKVLRIIEDDDSLFLLSKDERRMDTYVEKLKILLDEVKADMPNPASRNTGDVIGGIFSTSKPNQVDVKNPTKVVNKGEHLKNEERLKSEREKAIKVKAKAMKVCGYC